MKPLLEKREEDLRNAAELSDKLAENSKMFEKTCQAAKRKKKYPWLRHLLCFRARPFKTKKLWGKRKVKEENIDEIVECYETPAKL